LILLSPPIEHGRYWLSTSMVRQSVTHIRCPVCECAVLVLGGPPCPNCRRCPFCGRKTKSVGSPCNCDYAEDPDRVAWFWTDFVIPEEQVARETRRMEIRRQLETRKAIVAALVMSLLMIPGMAHRELFGDFTWTQFGLYVICAASVWLLHLRLVKCVFQKIEDRRLQRQDGSSHGTK
jgi:hypothetical protein